MFVEGEAVFIKAPDPGKRGAGDGTGIRGSVISQTGKPCRNGNELLRSKILRFCQAIYTDLQPVAEAFPAGSIGGSLWRKTRQRRSVLTGVPLNAGNGHFAALQTRLNRIFEQPVTRAAAGHHVTRAVETAVSSPRAAQLVRVRCDEFRGRPHRKAAYGGSFCGGHNVAIH